MCVLPSVPASCHWGVHRRMVGGPIGHQSSIREEGRKAHLQWQPAASSWMLMATPSSVSALTPSTNLHRLLLRVAPDEQASAGRSVAGAAPGPIYCQTCCSSSGAGGTNGVRPHCCAPFTPSVAVTCVGRQGDRATRLVGRHRHTHTPLPQPCLFQGRHADNQTARCRTYKWLGEGQ